MPRRVAIVEDDESLRAALTGLLRSAGFVVEGHQTAEHFLASGREASADCIVTDIQMPGMSGIDMAERLRAAGSRVPMVMITARNEPALEQRALSSGAVCLLRKPFEADELVRRVEGALDEGCPPLGKKD